METTETFLNIPCGACGIVKKKMKARTLSGAIRKVTAVCKGIQLTSNGVSYTRCHNGYTMTPEG